MELVGLITIMVIVLATVARGGNWFDFLNSDARYENWWINFEFKAFFLFLCLLVCGVAAWIFIQVFRPQPSTISSYQSKIVTSPLPKIHKNHATKSSDR